MNNYDTALVERLRAMAETCCAGGCDACDAEAKAADRIETLQAIEEAQNENVASLLERLEKLREALTQIARLRTDLRGDFSLGSKQSDIARAALGDTQ